MKKKEIAISEQWEMAASLTKCNSDGASELNVWAVSALFCDDN